MSGVNFHKTKESMFLLDLRSKYFSLKFCEILVKARGLALYFVEFILIKNDAEISFVTSNKKLYVYSEVLPL